MTGLERAVVAGGTGLVGSRLVGTLAKAGARVTVLSRQPAGLALPAGVEARGWEDLPATMDGADAIINLAGEGIAERRWSPARKAAIRDSRTGATTRLVEAMGPAPNRRRPW